jgi:hypothetical protein
MSRSLMKTLTEIVLVVLLDLVLEILSKSLSHFHVFTDPTCPASLLAAATTLLGVP